MYVPVDIRWIGYIRISTCGKAHRFSRCFGFIEGIENGASKHMLKGPRYRNLMNDVNVNEV
jgi:hypothetical protein